MKVSHTPKRWDSHREDVELPATDGVAWENFTEFSSDPLIDKQLVQLKQDVEYETAQGVPQDEESCLTQEFNQDVESGIAQQLSQDIDLAIAKGLSEDTIDIFGLISFLADRNV